MNRNLYVRIILSLLAVLSIVRGLTTSDAQAQIDTGSWTIVRITTPAGVDIGKLVVIGASPVTANGVTWQPHTEYWFGNQGAFGWPDNFNLIANPNGTLPASQAGAEIVANQIFASPVTAPAGSNGWRVNVGVGPAIAWADATHLNWWAEPAALVNGRLSLAQPLQLRRAPTPPPVSWWRSHP